MTAKKKNSLVRDSLKTFTNFTFHTTSDDVEYGDTGEARRATLMEALGIADILVGDVKGNTLFPGP